MARKSRNKGKNNDFLLQVLKLLLYIAFLPITLLYLLYRFTKKQLAENPEGVWYKQTWGIILVLTFFYPVGVYLLWKYGKFQKKGKQIATAVFGILFLISLISVPKSNKKVSRTMEYEKETQNMQPVTEAVTEKETEAEIENINRATITDKKTEVSTTESESITETQEKTTETAEIKPTQLYSDFFEPYVDSVGTLLVEGFQQSGEAKLTSYDVTITEGNEDDMWKYEIHDKNSEDYITIWFFPENAIINPSDWAWTLSLLTYETPDKEISATDKSHTIKPEYHILDKNKNLSDNNIKNIDELKNFLFAETENPCTSEAETEEPTTEEIITEPVTEPPTESPTIPPTEAPTVPVTQAPVTQPPEPKVLHFILNTDTNCIHINAGCSAAEQILPENYSTVDIREDELGNYAYVYWACGKCSKRYSNELPKFQ